MSARAGGPPRGTPGGDLCARQRAVPGHPIHLINDTTMTEALSVQPLDLTIEDRLRHVLLVGKTGVGKSTALRELAVKDASAGHGILLIDPHGDLASGVVTDLPRRRKNDLVRFDASSNTGLPGLAPLRSVPPLRRPLVASNVISVMKKLWPDNWGPRTEHLLRHVFLTLLELRDVRFDDARALLVDDVRRRSILKRVKDPSLLDFWTREFLGHTKPFLAELTSAPLNKLGAFLSSPIVRACLTRNRPRLDAARCLKRQAIVVASLPKGEIGADASLLLGGLLLGLFEGATFARTADERRKTFFIYVDEVSSFASAPLLSLVAESRKYGVGLVLATQSLAALDPEVRTALLGNIGTLMVFRVGAEDAELLSRELVSEVAPAHLQRLEIGERAVRSGNARTLTLPH